MNTDTLLEATNTILHTTAKRKQQENIQAHTLDFFLLYNYLNKGTLVRHLILILLFRMIEQRGVNIILIVNGFVSSFHTRK